MLTSVKKGKPINEEEIPPPVALGGKPNITAESEPVKEREPPEASFIPSPPSSQKPLREAAPTAPNTKPPKPMHLSPPQKPAVPITPETPAISPLTPCQPDAQHSGKRSLVRNVKKSNDKWLWATLRHASWSFCFGSCPPNIYHSCCLKLLSFLYLNQFIAFFKFLNNILFYCVFFWLS